MGLTPVDVKNWEFKKSIRGYNCQEVEEFIELVLKTLEENISQKEQLCKEIENLKNIIRQWESQQDKIKNIIATAKQQEANILAEAQNSAKKLIEVASTKAKKREYEIEEALKVAKGELYELNNLKQTYKKKFLHMLDNQKKLLQEFENLYQSTRITTVSKSYLAEIITSSSITESKIIKGSKFRKSRERGKDVSNSSEG